MAENQVCSRPGCQNKSSRYRCDSTSHFEFRETTDTDSDSSLWGDSDDTWYSVPEGALMSPEMMALHKTTAALVDVPARLTKKAPILYVYHAEKTASRPRSRSG